MDRSRLARTQRLDVEHAALALRRRGQLHVPRDETAGRLAQRDPARLRAEALARKLRARMVRHRLGVVAREPERDRFGFGAVAQTVEQIAAAMRRHDHGAGGVGHRLVALTRQRVMTDHFAVGRYRNDRQIAAALVERDEPRGIVDRRQVVCVTVGQIERPRHAGRIGRLKPPHFVLLFGSRLDVVGNGCACFACRHRASVVHDQSQLAARGAVQVPVGAVYERRQFAPARIAGRQRVVHRQAPLEKRERYAERRASRDDANRPSVVNECVAHGRFEGTARGGGEGVSPLIVELGAPRGVRCKRLDQRRERRLRRDSQLGREQPPHAELTSLARGSALGRGRRDGGRARSDSRNRRRSGPH